MSLVKILSIFVSLSTSTPDTIFRVYSVADTIYITSNDIVQVDTYRLFQLTYHLSKEMSDFVDSTNYNSCQIHYHLKNRNWEKGYFLYLPDREKQDCFIIAWYH